MQLIQAAVLGIVQGLTEFLPVSSSGHLILARELLGWKLLADPHWNTVFDVALHAGTFVALLLYFWSDILRLLQAFAASLRYGIAGDPDRRLAWVIVIATVPAAVAGALGESAIEDSFRQAPKVIAAFLIAFGVILWVAERRGRKARVLEEITWADGVLIGFAQALSFAPGVSRSGITMTMGLARGMKREPAARFSFLLSIPIVGGAALHGLHSVAQGFGALPQGSALVFLVGFLAAALSGYLCIRYFLQYLQKRGLARFVVYRIVLGLGVLGWLAVGRG